MLKLSILIITSSKFINHLYMLYGLKKFLLKKKKNHITFRYLNYNKMDRQLSNAIRIFIIFEFRVSSN